MTSENPKETKKSTMPLMLGLVVIVAGVAAGGLFLMKDKGALPSAVSTPAPQETAQVPAADESASAMEASAPAAGEPAAETAAVETTTPETTAETTTTETTTTETTTPETPQVIGEGESAVEVGNPVVAKVNGTEVTRGEVLDFITSLPEQVRQMPLQNLFPMARDQVINNKLVAEKAAAANLGNDPEVQKLVGQAQEQIARNVYIEREVAAKVNDAELQKAYTELKAEMAKVEEVKARHILVDTEDKAKEVITKLQGGAKFEDLVDQYSTGVTKETKGELGYFAKGEMVPEFADAAFALGKGQYTKQPVKTQFGYHVIESQDRRKREAPSFEEVKPQLESVVRQRQLVELLSTWQKSANVEKFDINGKPEAPAAEAPKN